MSMNSLNNLNLKSKTMKKVFLLCLFFGGGISLQAQTLEPGAPGSIVDLTPDGVEIMNTIAGKGNYGKKLAVIDTMVFFVGKDASNGEELWITDGTKSGTKLLKDINPGAGSSAPTNLEASGDKVFFAASDGSSGIELWVSDGTTEGTVRVKDIFSGSNSSSPDMITPFNGSVVFRATDLWSNLEEEKWLWISDGTADGTKMLSEIEAYNSGDAEPPIYYIQVAGNKAFFVGHDNKYGREMWVTDGTEEGTHMILDIGFEEDIDNPVEGATKSTAIQWQFAANESQVLFRAETPAWWINKEDELASIGEELWVTDGTAAGTYLLKDFNPALEIDDVTRTQGTAYAFPIKYDGRVFFRADDGIHHVEWCESDLTTEGTLHNFNINGAWEGTEAPSWLQGYEIVFDSLVYMFAGVWIDSSHNGVFPNVGYEVFHYDAKTDQVYLTYDHVPGSEGAYSGWPKDFVVVNDRMYYHAGDQEEASRKIWCMKPRAEDETQTPFLIFDEQGTENTIYHTLLNVGEKLVFISKYKEGEVDKQKLYIYDDGRWPKNSQNDAYMTGPPATSLKNSRITEYQESKGDTCDYHGPCVPESVDDLMSNKGFAIYPNPASEFLTLKLNSADEANALIVNAVGQVIWRQRVESGTQIPVKGYEPGLYVFMITLDGRTRTASFIIK